MEPKNPEKLLESREGMFILELERITPEIEELVQNSGVDEKMKKDALKLFNDLKEEMTAISNGKTKYFEHGDNVWGEARNTIGKLLTALGTRIKENEALFELMRDSIWTIVKSVDGGKQ